MTPPPGAFEQIADEHIAKLEKSCQDLIAEAEASGDDATRRAYMLQGAGMIAGTMLSMKGVAVLRDAIERETAADLARLNPPRVPWLRRLLTRWWPQ